MRWRPSRRDIAAGFVGAIAAPIAAAHSHSFDASVGVNVAGVRRFDRVAEAIAAAPGDRPFRIFIGAGVHHEKLVIDRANVHLVGEGPASVLSYNAAAGMARADGQAWGTWGCASVIVRAPDFSVRNLTVANAFDYIADLASPQFERTGSNGAQAVALMLDEGSDRALIENVRVTGHQDTLLANAGRALFRDCYISGSVDFIFGAGCAYFERCELQSRFRPLMQRNHGWIAVPSTVRTQAYGLVFKSCSLTREPQVPLASVALGRPWRPARQFADGRYGDPGALGMAAFLECWMDDHISADGWDEMGYPNREGVRVFLQPTEARFGEYASEGPGAFANRRRPQLRRSAARAISRDSVLDGWRP
ncbi:putative pectinesterase [alpha proteobacterium U9-1i]|nr:putative pectinesterase [alpha proteobacterium U9-1i]